MNVALVHDWLTGMRGGEKVLEQLARIFPEAPVYTLVHVEGSLNAELESRTIRTSFLQRLPAIERAYRWYLPLYPWAIESLDLSSHDLVISSSHCAAKAVLTRPDAVHLCYCHTPMRYAWDQFDAYFGKERVGRMANLAFRPVIGWLREWDRGTVGRVDAFAANSAYVASRIRRYYGRGATIVPPPVDTTLFTPDGRDPEPFHLMVTALNPYKRVEVAIEAFNRTGRRLIVVGAGPDRHRLDSLAESNVNLVGRVDDARLLELYRGCTAFILPGIEDAGIAPVEAMACGRPAIVLAEGGGREAVIDGETGVHFEACTPDALIAAVDRADGLSFNVDTIRTHAESFSHGAFLRRFIAFAERALGAPLDDVTRMNAQAASRPRGASSGFPTAQDTDS